MMNLKTTFQAQAKPEIVFAAIHQYKLKRNPASFFPSLFVKWQFRVLSENTLGIGATYDWKIWLLEFPVLAFQEKVIDWQEGSRVAYQAISGWEMNFCINLAPEDENTRVVVETSLSLPEIKFMNNPLVPVYNWGLQKVCMHGLNREGIKTQEYWADEI